MYEYKPQHPNHRERGLFFLFNAGGFVCLLVANLSDIAPIYELGMVFVGALLWVPGWVVARYVGHRYSYRIAPREDGVLGYDLTITDYGSRFRTVVTRIAVTDVTAIERLTVENRKELFKRAKGNKLYRYTECMGYDDTYLLWAVDGEETVCLLIHADDRLIGLLYHNIKTDA